MTSSNPMALEAKALEAAEDVKLVGQFWPGETALESEDSNWRHYRRERYAQIIRAYLAAIPLPAAGEGLEPVGYISSDGFTVLIPDDKAADFKAAWDALPMGPLPNKALPFYLAPPATPAARAAVLEPVDLLTQFYAIRIGKAPLPISRDELGREVRTAWVRWAEQQASPKPHWLTPYDNLSEADKEADRQIGLWMANVVLDKFLELNPPSDARTRLVATPAARAAVLEEAAQVAETGEGWIGEYHRTPNAQAAPLIAAAIRALKEKT